MRVKRVVSIVGLALVLAVAGFWWRGRTPGDPPRAQTSTQTSTRYGAEEDSDVTVEEAMELALGPYRGALEATRRAVVHIGLEAFPEDGLQASKVGGRAWWPAGHAAPAGEDGRPLVLLAQINLAEVPAMPGWPERGLLQFFIAANNFYGANFDAGNDVETLSRQRNFRVVYWADPSVQGQALAAGHDGDGYLPHNPHRPRRMRFEAGTETVSGSDYRIDDVFGGDAWQVLERWAEENGFDDETAYVILEELGGPGHKLGGYPFFTQTDPRDSGPMELLLQLDSDDEMTWGDMGVGGFFIDPADLARADFSRVMYNWDCH